MGLLYILPQTLDEYPLVKECEKFGPKTLKLRSYNLPPIFFLYYIAIFATILVLWLASYDLLERLFYTNDPINQLLALSAAFCLLIIPVIMTTMWFYKKTFFKKEEKLLVTNSLFGINFWKKEFDLGSTPLEVKQSLESPNMARLENRPSMKGFQNRGHFLLFIQEGKKEFVLDRHSSKSEMNNLKEFLESY